MGKEYDGAKTNLGLKGERYRIKANALKGSRSEGWVLWGGETGGTRHQGLGGGVDLMVKYLVTSISKRLGALGRGTHGGMT